MTDETMTAEAETHHEPVQAMTIVDTVAEARRSAALALIPLPIAEMEEIAHFMSKARSMVPQHFIGQPDACLAVVYQAARWGMDPFAVAQKAYIAKQGGTIGYEAQLVHSLVESSGRLQEPLRLRYEGDALQRRIVVIGRVRGAIEDQVYASPRIVNIRPRNSPLWTSDPDQQLAYYGVRAWARRFSPSVLLGVYTPDELAFNDMLNVTPKEAAKAYDVGDLPAPSGGSGYTNKAPDAVQQKGEQRGGMQDQPPKSPPPPPAARDPWAKVESVEEWYADYMSRLEVVDSLQALERLGQQALQHGWFHKLGKAEGKDGPMKKTLAELGKARKHELSTKEAAEAAVKERGEA